MKIMAVAVAIALTSSIISTPTHAHPAAPDDSTCLLQSSIKVSSRKTPSANKHEPGPGQDIWGGKTAIIPPVQLNQPEYLDRLGTVSTPGSWKDYYKTAESAMDLQWSKIYPMINASNFGTVLEVAAGACRNTEKLIPLADRIIVTDIDPIAVEVCRHRFANRTNLKDKMAFVVVDGIHIPVKNGTITMVYQFDSGVHFHREVIRNYLKEFERVLVPGGTGFFHHSNLAAAPDYDVNDDVDVTENQAWRSNMSNEMFEELLHEAGLELLCHPVVNWAGQEKIDGIARFRKPGGTPYQGKSEICPREIDFPEDPFIALAYMFDFIFLFVCGLVALILFVIVLLGMRCYKATKKKPHQRRYGL